MPQAFCWPDAVAVQTWLNCYEGTEAEQIGVTTEQTLAVELPVSWTEDGDVLCYVTFEFNDEKILAHQPVETWKSGKHILSLYYPIEDVAANVTNTFNVYLRMAGGTGAVEIGGCISSISGQSMGAAAVWDGRITIEEKISLFSRMKLVHWWWHSMTKVKKYLKVVSLLAHRLQKKQALLIDLFEPNRTCCAIACFSSS